MMPAYASRSYPTTQLWSVEGIDPWSIHGLKDALRVSSRCCANLIAAGVLLCYLDLDPSSRAEEVPR